MQPYHAIDDGRWAEKRIGPDRIKTTYAFRSLLDRGAVLAFGSDWTVAPIEPLLGIYAAVTRRTLDGKNPDGWVPQEKISVEEALRASSSNDLTCEYSLIPPMPGVGGPLFTGLVVRCPWVAGEVRVVAVSLVRHMVSTLPGSGPVDLPAPVEALRESLRSLGIAGVTGHERRYDPFPGDGLATFEMMVIAPATSDAGGAQSAEAGEGQPVEWHTSPDAGEIARRIQAWRNAAVLSYPPGPCDPSSLGPLRAIAQARRALLAAVDRERVEALRLSGRLGEAWALAGLRTAIGPERLEQAGISWKVYQEPMNILGGLNNALVSFKQYWDSPRDGALWQMDLAFARASHPLFTSNRYSG